MAIIISIGKWGGVYSYKGFGWRLCLGWIAITYLPIDGDEILDAASKYYDKPAQAQQQPEAEGD